MVAPAHSRFHGCKQKWLKTKSQWLTGIWSLAPLSKPRGCAWYGLAPVAVAIPTASTHQPACSRQLARAGKPEAVCSIGANKNHSVSGNKERFRSLKPRVRATNSSSTTDPGQLPVSRTLAPMHHKACLSGQQQLDPVIPVCKCINNSSPAMQQQQHHAAQGGSVAVRLHLAVPCHCC